MLYCTIGIVRYLFRVIGVPSSMTIMMKTMVIMMTITEVVNSRILLLETRIFVAVLAFMLTFYGGNTNCNCSESLLKVTGSYVVEV